LAAVAITWAAGGLPAQVDADGQSVQDGRKESRPAGARQLLDRYGFEDRHWSQFQDNQPLAASEEELIARLLYYLPRLPRESLRRWTRAEGTAVLTSGTGAGAEPGGVWRIVGRARRVERVPLPVEAARRLEFAQFFRVTLSLEGPARSVEVVARRVPDEWRLDTDIDEPAVALAVLLKRSPDQEGKPRPLLAAARVQWYPDRVNPARGVKPDHVLLARLGLDIGLLGDERGMNGQPIRTEDHECFYGLLFAMQRAGPRLVDFPAPPLRIASLLQEPREHHGEILLVEGRARNVTRILVDDPEVLRRFQLDHYYQIDLFVPLENEIVRLTRPEDPDEDVPTFENVYPVTVCVPSLPDGLSQGESLPQDIRVRAAFLRLWAYQSEYVSSFGKERRQLSPMLIGVQPELVPAEPLPLRLGAMLAVLVVLGMLGIGWGMMRSRRDASLVRQMLTRESPNGPPDESAVIP
jgi:hypothetical protein